jgi:ATP-binding cassette subfamily B protein
VKLIFTFLKPYKAAAVAAFSLMLTELAAELLLPYFLGRMINEGVLAKDMDRISFWGGIMIGTALLSFAAGILNSFYSAHVSYAFGYDLRSSLFRKVQSFSCSTLNKYAPSALITRFTNDIRQIQNTVFMSLRIMAKAPLTVIGGVIMAFVVNGRLAAVFLITVPVLIGFLYWVFKVSRGMFRNMQDRVDRLNRVMQENLAGMRIIKAFWRRDYERIRFERANEDLSRATRTAFQFIEASSPVLFFVMNMSLAAILWFGSQQIGSGQTNVGQVVSVVNYALRVSMSMSMFSFIITSFSRTKASADRIGEIMRIRDVSEETGAADPNLAVTKGKVEFRHVTFSFPDKDEPVLKDISFTVNPGEKLAIIGATGAGKTSLFLLLPRLFDVQSGEILIDDSPITAYPVKNLRNGIGFIPQTPFLFSGTIRENIAWGNTGAAEEEIIRAAEDAQIHAAICNFPDRYDTRVGQKGVNLSGGQKQRISIARALVRKPKILLMDDSTSALDAETESRLLEAIRRYRCTTILITQKISTARMADKICLIDDGRIAALGTHEELLEASPLYRKIAESQSGKEWHYAR